VRLEVPDRPDPREAVGSAEGLPALRRTISSSFCSWLRRGFQVAPSKWSALLYLSSLVSRDWIAVPPVIPAPAS
jgi:hypothetical protein